MLISLGACTDKTDNEVSAISFVQAESESVQSEPESLDEVSLSMFVPEGNAVDGETSFPTQPDQSVNCFSWLGPVQNEKLWLEWLACYRAGEPAQVTINVVISPTTATYRLTADGSERYKIELYAGEDIKTMMAVGVREYPLYYAIGIDGYYYETAFLTKSNPEDLTEWNGLPILPSYGDSPAQALDVDLAAFPTLGETTPAQALELIENDQQVWFDPNGKPRRLELAGAFLLAGHPFYAIANRADADFPDVATCAVNADGGDIILQIELEWGYWHTVKAGTETIILPDKKLTGKEC